MHGELARSITSLAHGNLFLHGGQVDLSSNPAFQHVGALMFVRCRNKDAPQGQQEYDLVTAELYEAITVAVVMASNSLSMQVIQHG